MILHDIELLYQRICTWKPVYLEALSLKRKRENFHLIFRSFYSSLRFDSLQLLDLDFYKTVDQFYEQVQELHWYLTYTEDLPISVDDHVTRVIKKLDELYQEIQNPQQVDHAEPLHPADFED